MIRKSAEADQPNKPERKRTPKSAYVALGLVLFAIMSILNSVPGNRITDVNWSDGESVGRTVGLPILLCAVALVLAINAIATHVRRARLWPAYSTLVLVGLVAIATGLLLADRPQSSSRGDSPSERERVSREMHAVFDDFAQRVNEMNRIAESCGEVCSPMEIVATPGAREMGLVAGRDCTTPETICIAEVPEGLRIETLSKNTRKLGVIRIDTLFTPDGNQAGAACMSLAKDPPEDVLDWVCGRGFFSEVPERGPLP